MKFEDRLIKVKEALSSPVLVDGALDLRATLAPRGLHGRTNRLVAQTYWEAQGGKVLEVDVGRPGPRRQQGGMPLGPKAAALDWSCLKDSAIYKIVNKHNGRYWVLCSIKPYVDRSIKLFWLRNPRKRGSTNSVLSTPLLLEDVERFGADAFYFEVIELCPGTPNAELQARKQALLDELRADPVEGPKLYNVVQQRQRKKLNPEWERLHAKWRALVEHKKTRPRDEWFDLDVQIRSMKAQRDREPKKIPV